MNGVFRYRLHVQSIYPERQTYKDPYQVRRWARYFNMNPSDLIASFCFYLLEVLKKRIAFSVETQTIDGRSMKSIFKELNPHYKKQNPKNKDKFWYDTEFLIRSLRVWAYNNEIFLGIPKHIKHPTSGTPAYLIFQWLEFGTKTKTGKRAIPPRPIIMPHLRFILKRTDVYFIYFIKLCMEKQIVLSRNIRVKMRATDPSVELDYTQEKRPK